MDSGKSFRAGWRRAAWLLVATGVTLLTIAQAHAQPSSSPEPPLLTLPDALVQALKKNPQVETADLQVRIAQQDLAAQRTERLPVFATGATGNIQILTSGRGQGDTPPVPGPVPVFTDRNTASVIAGVATYQPITFLRAIGLKIHMSAAKVDMARELLRGEEQKVVASVRGGYYQVLEIQVSLDALEETLRSNRELERTVANQVENGSALRLDLLEVRLRQANLEQDRVNQQNALATSKESLNRLLGRDIRTPFRVSEPPTPESGPDELAALQDLALRQRPEVRQADNQILQARLQWRLAKEEFTPEFGIGLVYFQSPNIEFLDEPNMQIVARLAWEFWDWGRRRAHVRARGLAITQAEVQKDDSEAAVLTDVNSRFRNVQSARSEIAASQVSLETARERLRVTQGRYAQQVALLSDVLKAQSDLAEANRRYQQALLGYLTAISELARAVGER